MKKRRRFQEGGDIPDIDREPLRDSSGEIVRSSSGEAVMSGGADKDRAMGIAMREARDAAAMDQAMLRGPRAETSVATPSPIMTKPRIEAKGDTELVEPSTAGFSRAPTKTATKPAVKAETPRAAPKAAPKAEIKPSDKKDVKAEIERLKAYDKPIERVTPEMNLVGGPLLKGLKAAGAGLAAKLAPQAAKARVEPRIPQEAAKALTVPQKAAKSAEVAIRGGDLATRGGELAAKGKDLVKRRESMPQLESPRGRLPFEKNMGKARLETQANKRRQLGGSSRSDDVIEMGMKRGGKVGSASSRGDGIAKRGKTRGRYI
jgi:hypothetical protein